MKFLLLTSALPYPPTSGGALRVFSLIRALVSLGHNVHVLAYADSATDWQQTPLAALCASVRTVPPPPARSASSRLKTLLLRHEADVAQRLASGAMATALRETLSAETFDVVQAEGIEMAWLLPLVKDIQPTARRSFDTFNAEYQLQRVIASIDARVPRRWPVAAYSWLQSGRIARFERDMMALSDIVIAVSPEDAKSLGALLPATTINVIPSAIPVADYQDAEPLPLGTHALVFTGKMDYRPNVDAALWFADEILPRVRLRVPDVSFHIVGQQPHLRIDRLRTEGVQITGYVPSVVPYLRGAALYVAPLRMGSGTRLKLLEAMAAGCAIVATPIAASGLLAEATAAMRLAASADRFADTIITLLANATERKLLGEQAQAAVSAYYDWTAIAAGLRRVYQEAGGG